MRGARLEPVLARVRPRLGGHLPVLVDHHDLRQVVPLAHLEVVRIVRRRHLDRAGAERRIDELIGHDRELAPDDRQAHRASDRAEA